MPQTTVAAVITNSVDGIKKILLTQRNIEPFKGQWCLPGGHIDPNESARNAIIREVKEETGLNFDAHFFTYFDEILPSHKIHAVVLAFEGYAGGKLQAQQTEVSKLEWIPLEEAHSLPLAFTHNEILERYASR